MFPFPPGLAIAGIAAAMAAIAIGVQTWRLGSCKSDMALLQANYALLAQATETQNAAILAHEKATQDAKKRGAAARVAAEKRAVAFKSDADRLGAEIDRLRTAPAPVGRAASCEALESAVRSVREGLKQ